MTWAFGRRQLIGDTARGAALSSIALLTLVASGTSATHPTGPYAGQRLYAAPTAAADAARNPDLRGSDRAKLRWLATIPQAVWLNGGQPAAAAQTVTRTIAAARITSTVASFVVYDIPHRDCAGGQSAGGAPTAQDYRNYVAGIAHALGTGPAIVILEPDSLAGLDCLTPARQADRLTLEHWAVTTLAAHPGVTVYLDGGVRGWRPPATMAKRLIAAGVANARGFAVDVSNFDTTNRELPYGRSISSLVGWKHFIIDTSRNAAPVRGWCNPNGARIGTLPTTATPNPGVDALLWIKHPGESDGACGTSATPAGDFDVNLALTLTAHADPTPSPPSTVDPP